MEGDVAVYPRVCGGTEPRTTNQVTYTGLSPRVRGNHRRTNRGAGTTRSIPACAGEPQADAATPPRSKVYPRVCGGTPPGGFDPAVHGGLSPRVRGNPHDGGPDISGNGSIPACAGEPGYAPSTSRLRRVYPRVCGGTLSVGMRWVRVRGLSPRVRGNPFSFW